MRELAVRRTGADRASPVPHTTAPAREFYRSILRLLRAAGVRVLVGGAYALAAHTGVRRHTKDLDIFLRPEDLEAALAALARTGCRTEVTYPHWLAKAHGVGHFVDIIFNLGNGLSPIDDEWFRQAVP